MMIIRYSFLILVLLCLISSSLFGGALAQAQCGREAGGALCPGGLCCSKWGYCGITALHCGDGCQSQCKPIVPPPPPPPPPTSPPPPPSPPAPPPPPGGGDDLTSLISRSLFEELLPYRNNPACEGAFYTYDAFIEAAKSFSSFAATGDTYTRKREIAAFLAQTSHETTGGWAEAPGGPYSWGYCFIKERNPGSDYCDPSSSLYPCAPGKSYYGRGPIQISWNYNYGQAGEALQLNLLNNPDLVVQDPIVSFKTAFWFWMTPQSPKPSCHDVIIGQWQPSSADIAVGRLPGYGVTTNIINGGLECGQGQNDKVLSRIGFYQRYCSIMGVSPGDNLDCYSQRPFGWGLNFDAVN